MSGDGGYQSPAYVRKCPAILGYAVLATWSVLALIVVRMCISTYKQYTYHPETAFSSSCQQGFAAVFAVLMLPPFLLTLAYHTWRWKRTINLIMAGFCMIMSLALVGGIMLVEAADIQQPETCN